MALSFHHLFLFTTPGAPVVDELIAGGFVEGSRNTHLGQGTSNRRIFFENGMLEFIWVSSLEEVQSKSTAPTRLYERSRHNETGYSPFGICVQSLAQAKRNDIFRGWPYQPPYLPRDYEIWMADNKDKIHEPAIFHLDTSRSVSTNSAEPLNHANGVRRLKEITISMGCTNNSPSDALTSLASIPMLKFQTAQSPFLEIKCESHTTSIEIDLTDQCALKMCITQNV